MAGLKNLVFELMWGYILVLVVVLALLTVATKVVNRYRDQKMRKNLDAGKSKKRREVRRT